MPFDTGSGRARLVAILLGLLIMLDLIAIWSTYQQIDLLTRVAEGESVSFWEASANDDRQQAIAMLQMLAYWVTAIAFLIWLHHVHSNLPALGVRGTTYTPGWAVGSFFVPIMSLVWPYQAVKEVWQASDPDTLDESAWRSTPSSWLLRWWWLLFLFMNITSAFVGVLARDTRKPSDLLSVSWVLVAATVLQIVAAVSAILVVRAINGRQNRKSWRRYHTRQQRNMITTAVSA